MNEEFDAEDFVRKLSSGAFDGRVLDELGKLSSEQLEEVAKLMAERQKNPQEKPSGNQAEASI